MKQLFSYLMALGLWATAVVTFFKKKCRWLLPSLALLHFTELLCVGLDTGKKYGCSRAKSVTMCMLYGFLWWLPLKQRMAEDDLSEEDFIEDGQEPWREAFER